MVGGGKGRRGIQSYQICSNVHTPVMGYALEYLLINICSHQ